MPPSSRRHPVPAATMSLLLADGRLPVGGHVFSAGIEPALLGGMPSEQACDFMIGRARTVSMIEAGTAVVARHITLTEPPDRIGAGLGRVEAAWAARTPSPELRIVSRLLARGYTRLAQRMWPADAGVAACGEDQRCRPVVLGAIAAAAGLDAEGLVRLVLYEDAQSAAAALLKIEPIDPAVPVGWVLQACGAAEDLVPLVAALTSPAAIPATGAPQNEEWAQAHSLRSQRLFRA